MYTAYVINMSVELKHKNNTERKNQELYITGKSSNNNKRKEKKPMTKLFTAVPVIEV